MKHPQIVRWIMIGAWALGMGSLAPVLAQDATAFAEPKAACEAQPVLVADASEPAVQPPDDAADVQGRAVPRMAPGMTPAPHIEGGIFEGKRLRARPGFHFEKQAESAAMLRPNSGGNGVTLSCRCTKGKGCIMTIESGTSAYCSTNGCSGDCEMRLTTGALSPGLRMQ